MKTFIIRRALSLPLILLGISLIAFFLMHLIPGDPARMFFGAEAANITPEAIEHLRQQWGLDRSLVVQYLFYIRNLICGDLGQSVHTASPVLEDVFRRLPATIELGGFAFLIAVVISIPLGVLAGVKKDTLLDHLSRLSSLFFLSMPNFWIGLILIYVFFFMFHLMPAPMGRLGLMVSPPPTITGMYTLDSLLTGDFPLFLQSLRQLIWPALVLSLPTIALVTRMLRTSIIEVMSLDYVRTAQAKGLPQQAVVFHHILRNALIPTITILGIELGRLSAGSVVIETVFNWPGIGLYFVTSIQWLDYAPVTGTAMLISGFYVIANFFADFAYALTDPRIRY